MARDDGYLLRRYIEEDSQESFAQLTERYMRLVYGTCLRELHNATLAEDATQVVFLILSRQASRLRSPSALASWLFSAVRLTARQIRTREQLRQEREQQAFQEDRRDQEEDLAWRQIADRVNDAVATLNAQDREAVLQAIHVIKNDSFVSMSSDALALYRLAYGVTSVIPRRAFNMLDSFLEPDTDGNQYYSDDHQDTSGQGHLLRISGDGTRTTVHTFTGPDGSLPIFELLRTSGGSYYGATRRGGTHNQGTIFRWTPAGTL